jgi:tetratricopeptide (TPR) repeat protein
MRSNRVATVAFVLCLLIGFAQPALADAIRLKNGQVLRGERVLYKRKDKVFIVFTKEAELTYAEDQVSGVTVARPKEYAQAVKMIESGSAAGAIPVLKAIMKKYHKLEWDRRAKPLLAEAYFRAGDSPNAIRECEAIFDDPGLAVSSRLTKLYLSALHNSKDYEKIETMIVKMIGTGSRGSAAMAQMFRGDIFVEQKKYQEALTKGYLRTVEFFQDVKEMQPKALAKTIECYEKLGESKKAEVFRKRLLAKHPRSEYAQRLQ